jgi:hypothetical protein
MARPSKPKRKQKRNSAPDNLSQLNDSSILERIGTGRSILPSQPNASDNLAIQKLYKLPVGELPVDRFAPDAPKPVQAFRHTLINVYMKAAQARYLGKPTKGQLTAANTAQSQLTRALTKLDQVSPVGQRGLQLAVAGSPMDDMSGERELNEFASTCRKIRIEVAPHALDLREAIRTEKARQTKSGERQKRLRTLVEALADWWQSLGGSLAPTVDASRRDDAPAVVHERYGKFLELAVALFCHVDVFKQSEVEAAVTNVYEARLNAARSRSGN